MLPLFMRGWRYILCDFLATNGSPLRSKPLLLCPVVRAFVFPIPENGKNKMIAIRICWLALRFVSIGGKVVTQKDRKHLGDGIRKHRKLAGLTQEKLAEKVDLNPVYMGQIERGYKVPTVDVLLRIAKALKVKLRDLVHEL
jgi:DNA-binding XRE family transcriptional regulator